jgi:hypothetical protein
MDIQHIAQRWLIIITVLLCVILALVFAAIQTGLL